MKTFQFSTIHLHKKTNFVKYNQVIARFKAKDIQFEHYWIYNGLSSYLRGRFFLFYYEQGNHDTIWGSFSLSTTYMKNDWIKYTYAIPVCLSGCQLLLFVPVLDSWSIDWRQFSDKFYHIYIWMVTITAYKVYL